MTNKKSHKIGSRLGCRTFLNLVKSIRRYLNSNEKIFDKTLTNISNNAKILYLFILIMIFFLIKF